MRWPPPHAAAMRASVTPKYQATAPPLIADVEERRRLWRSLVRREVLRLALRGDKVRPELLRWAEGQE